MAGTSFAGQISQNFIVLTDKGVRKGGRQVILTGGNKRTLKEGKDNETMAKKQAEGSGRGGGGGRGGAMARGGKHTPRNK